MISAKIPISLPFNKLEQPRKNENGLNFDKLKKRAKAKFSQKKLIDSLIALNTSYSSRYINTLNCAGIIQKLGDKIISRYCGNRWCKICNRIRTGKLINGYTDQLDKLTDKQFVTLTVPNVPAEILRETIVKMTKTFQLINDKLRKAKIKLKGIRKLECTYNSELNNYHPHFHIIIESKKNAKTLLNNWLQYFPQSNKIAQDIRPAKNYKELFKYFAKLTSKSKILKNNKLEKIETHYPEAIHIIFKAIEKLRIIQPFGGLKMVKDDVKELIAENIDEKLTKLDNGTFIWFTHTWINVKTGEILADWFPDDKLSKFSGQISYICPN